MIPSTLNSQLSTINYSYDSHGRLSTSTDARNGPTSWTYQYNSDLVSTITTPNPGTPGGSPQTTINYYNPMLQVTNVVQPDATSVTNEFYPTGQLKRQYGSRIYPVGYGYDYAGRVLTMTNWTAFPATGTRVTTWNYNPSRGWLDSKTYDGGAAGPSYQYTPAGRLQSRTWARNITTTYTYDNAGGLATVGYSDGTTPGVSYTYDRRGRPATTTQNGIQDTLTYNDANLLLSEAYSGGLLANLSITSGYDQYLRRSSLVLNNQQSTLQTINYGYDNASRLQTVTDATLPGTPYSATYSYLANSPLVSNIVFKQSSTTRMSRTNQWDYLNRLLSVSSAPSAASALSFAYSFNAANQRTRTALADNSFWLFNYDSLGQVTTGHKYFSDQTPVAGQQFDYTFDTIGNRTSTKAGGDQNGANQRSANYGANSLNQYTNRTVPGYADIMGVSFATNTVTVGGQAAYRKVEYFRNQLPVSNGSAAVWTNIVVAATGQTSVTGSVFIAQSPEYFTNDVDGNLTQDGRWTYTWDAENRLINITSLSSAPTGSKFKLDFVYDPQGRRIQKLVSTNNGSAYYPQSTNRFIYDGWNLIAVLNPQSALIRSFVWGLDVSGSAQGAGGVGGLLEINDAINGVHFAAYDGNGNVGALVKAVDGTTSAQYEYTPFGEVIRATGPMAKLNPFLFSTKFYDWETGVYYYNYRYYDPSSGRWLSRDSAGESGGLNLNVFNRNDPISFIDPDGAAPQMVGFTYNPDTGGVSPQYVDQQFGQDYGMGLHNPFNPPSQMIMNQRALWEKTTCCQNAATFFAVYMVTDVAAGLAATAENPPKAIVGQVRDLGHLGSGVRQGTLNGVLEDVRRVSSLILVAVPIKGACCSRAGVTANQTALVEARAVAQAAAQRAAKETTLSVARSNIRWVSENASMGGAARAYESGAAGAREGMAPALVGPGGNLVKFDGLEGCELIDRKSSVTTFPKSQYQAFRQSEALQANGFTGRWEVPTQAEANRANQMFNRLGINNITVVVVPR